MGLGALARGVHGLVLEQQERVGPRSRDDVGVHDALQGPAVQIRHVVGAEPRAKNLEHHGSRLLDCVQDYMDAAP